jgi:PBP1b-binding outer membrane lipoprotein LpoB
MIAKPKDKNKNKIALSNEKVRDITFFEEDISELSKQLSSAEGLYTDLYGVYTNLTGGRYANVRSPRDIAEIAKALVSMRSLCVDTAFKRHQVRKNLSDIVYRTDGGDISDADLIKNTARNIINEVRNYVDGKPIIKQIEGKSRVISDETRNELDSKVEEYINTGEIKLSTNDKLIGVSDHIEFKFDKGKDSYVAFDNRSGRAIPNFPQERLPDKKISKFTRNEVITQSGDSYEIIGGD